MLETNIKGVVLLIILLFYIIYIFTDILKEKSCPYCYMYDIYIKFDKIYI